MIREGRSFSGRERNCCFLNTGSGRFADVSSVTNWGLSDDGRALALVDWDGDGDLDVWLANRTAPRLRLLRNDLTDTHRFLQLRLEGRGASCNRDAIGARLELQLDGPQPKTRVKTVSAGSGFLSQSSRWVHFGLGRSQQIAQLTVRWPDGTVEQFDGLQPDRHYRIVQAAGHAQPWHRPGDGVHLEATRQPVTATTGEARIVLSGPLPLPEMRYKDLAGNDQSFDRHSGPLLVNLFATWCGPCANELNGFVKAQRQLENAGLQVLALKVPPSSSGDTSLGDPDELDATRQFVDRLHFPFHAGMASRSAVKDMDLVQRSLISLQQPLPLPTSFLLDRRRCLRVIYKGPVEVEQLLNDVRNVEDPSRSPVDDAAAFPGRWHARPVAVTPMSVAMKFVEDGQYGAATRYLRRAAATDGQRSSTARPGLADMHHMIGTILLEQGERREAITAFQQALQVDGDYWRSHFDLGILFFKAGELQPAIDHFSEAVRLKPNDADMLNKLGLATMGLGQLGEAVSFFQRALDNDPASVVALFNMGLAEMRLGNVRSAVDHFAETLKQSPNDAQAHFYLGNLLGGMGRHQLASEHYGQALRQRPGWPVAANNLAWLLATSGDSTVRDPARAVRLAEWVVQRMGRTQPTQLDTLAAAFAAAGRFDEAVETARQAVELAEVQESQRLAGEIRQRLQLYESDTPFHEPAER